MRKITELKKLKNLKHTRVLLRADFNVRIKNGKIIDTFRIDKTIKTIEFLQKTGASIVILSHLGSDGKETLKPVYDYLAKKKKLPIMFYEGCIDERTVAFSKILKPKQIVLIENIRKNKGEKENDAIFSKLLSELGDIYINDAFSVSHRAHASVVGVAKKLPAYAGFQLVEEVSQLSKAFSPKHPFLFIIGGVKFGTKLPLIKKYLKSADDIFIGGALANQVFYECGLEVGESLVEKNNYKLSSLVKNNKIMLPVDVCAVSSDKKRNALINDITKKENMLDIGEDTVDLLIEKIREAKFILWNGPVGKYDIATRKLLKEIAKSKATSIIGGGDTVEVISKYKMEKDFTFVSTGGGATLDFLSSGTLPGIKVLSK